MCNYEDVPKLSVQQLVGVQQAGCLAAEPSQKLGICRLSGFPAVCVSMAVSWWVSQQGHLKPAGMFLYKLQPQKSL